MSHLYYLSTSGEYNTRHQTAQQDTQNLMDGYTISALTSRQHQICPYQEIAGCEFQVLVLLNHILEVIIMTLQFLEELITRTVLAEMISAAEAANVPASFLKHIKLEKVSDTEYRIVNDWHTFDPRTGKKVPLARFFEYGTDRHWIEPVDAKVLAWPSGGPQSGRAQAIYSKRADNTKGDMRFSKGHYVSGIIGYEPMNQGFRHGIKKMKQELEDNKNA